jgi:hypothetical protein
VPAGSKEPAYWAFPGASTSTNAACGLNDKSMPISKYIGVRIYFQIVLMGDFTVIASAFFHYFSNKYCRPTAETGAQPTAAGMTGNIRAYNRHLNMQ